MSELNSRQWALYRYLKERGNQWTVQAIAAAEIPEYDYDGEEDYAQFHDSAARVQMTADIRAINDSRVIQKIIISSPKGIKIASEEEFKKYISREYGSVFRRLKRIRIKERKGLLDGQMRLVFKTERETIEAFLREGQDV